MIEETNNGNGNGNDNEATGEHPSLDVLAMLVHETSVSKGFWSRTEEPSMDQIAGKIALAHSELSELLEALRKDKGSTAINEEVSDTLIRVLDIWAALYEWDYVEDSLQESFDDKAKRNMERPAMHGHRWG